MELPTLRWRRLVGEDRLFNEDNIAATEGALTKFQSALAIASNDVEARAAVRLLVLSLNSLNETNSGGEFIETSEREELCKYIANMLRAAGFELGSDPTEEWREW